MMNGVPLCAAPCEDDTPKRQSPTALAAATMPENRSANMTAGARYRPWFTFSFGSAAGRATAYMAQLMSLNKP